MSHIPATAVPHAKAHDQDTHGDTQAPTSSNAAVTNPASTDDSARDTKASRSKTVSADAARLGREAMATVKAHPKTAIAIGATIVAGAVAAVAAPLLAKRDDTPKRAARAKKSKAA